jgi:hypothetical protein
MSTIVTNSWQWTDGQARNHVLQFKHAVTTAYSTTGSISLGSNSAYTAAPTSTTGIELLSTTFQPRSATSIIIVKTNPIGFTETSNVSDDTRMSCFAGTTLLGWNHSGLLYTISSNNNQNIQMNGLHAWTTSWGTDNRTISLRFDTSGANGTYYRINFRDVSSWQAAPIHLTIMEIAQ